MSLFAISLYCATGRNLQAATYYVDSVSGSDTNSGTSPGTAWMTLAKVSGKTFAAGDQILFQRNQVFRGNLTVVSSGTAGNPIVFASYGTGTNRPAISGANDLRTSVYSWIRSTHGTNEYFLQLAGGGTPVITEPKLVWRNNAPLRRGASGLLANLQWNWGNNDSLGTNTVYLRSDGGIPGSAGESIEAGSQDYALMVDTKSNICFQGLEFEKSQGPWEGTITLRDSGNIVLTNCLIHDAATYDVAYLLRIHGCGILNCAAFGNRTTSTYGSVIEFETCNSNVVRNSTIYDTDASLGDVVEVYQSNNNLVEGNEVAGPGGNGIYCRPQSNCNILRYNFIHDVNGIGVQIRENSNSNLVYYNVLLNNYGPVMQSDGQNGSNPAICGTHFYNNTIVSTGAANGIHIFGTNTGCEAINNIIISDRGDALLVSTDSVAGTKLANNCYKNTSGMMISYKGVTYTRSQFANFKTASHDTNSLSVDPLFASSAPRIASDIRLSSGSTLIDAGVVITNQPMDYFGHAVPSNQKTDIGAAEYIGPAPTPGSPPVLRVTD